MSAPLTPWEVDGSWTSITQETDFLAQIAVETTARVTVAGRSVQSRPVWRAEIGNATGQTLLIVANQHGNEPASREAALILFRDLAYTTDPDILAYLSAHRVIVVPAANPDGTAVFGRGNGNGVDINRDWWRLEQPEPLALTKLIRDTKPVIIVDAHETSTDDGAHWRPYAAGLPGGHAGLTGVAAGAVQAAADRIALDGWVTAEYPVTLLPWAGLSTVAAAHHAAGILSETVTSLSRGDRITMQRAVLGAVVEYHRTHLTEAAAARAASLAVVPSSVPIPSRTYIGVGPIQQATLEHGYVLAGALPPRIVDAWSLTVSDGVVPLRQRSWLAVGALLDRQSMQRIVDAYRDKLPVSSPAMNLRVKRGGVVYRVGEVWVKRDGVRRRVGMMLVKRGGMIRRI